MGVPGSANLLLLAGGGYQIERSLRFNSADSAYLNRTPASAGNRKTWTVSVWIKRARVNTGNYTTQLFSAGASASSDRINIAFSTSSSTGDNLSFGYNPNNAGWNYVVTTALFRDPSAWYHFVITVDTTQATSSNRIKIYVNGAQQTDLATASYPSQNIDLAWNNNVYQVIGAYNLSGTTAVYTDSYFAEFHGIDGTALTPSSFGETDTITGVWKPKRYAGTYGTNGFYLKFADNSGTTSTTLGKDSSGNGNNWTPNNFSVTAGAGNDSLIDTPTPYADGGNGRGNYCTWNPLDRSSSTTLTNGNLNATSTVADWRMVLGSFGMTSGKWYWELTISGTVYHLHGIAKATVNRDAYVGSDANGWGYYAQSGTYNSGSYINTSTYASYTAGDVISVAFDADSGKIWWAKNGTWQGSGNPAAGTNAAYTGLTSGPYFPAASHFSSTNSDANFGQRSFSYTPPSGFLALNTQNLPEPTIKKPSGYFDTKLYTGNNGTLTVTGLGFSPDLVWIKNREVAGTGHAIQDTVRGATAYVFSNSTSAENTNTSNNWFRAFTSDGFTVAATTSGGTPTGEWNNNGSGYVAWCWDESATPGFDIVTYTGNGTNRTIAHSLGVAPSMIIAKCRSTANDWAVYHSANTAAPETDYLLLNSTAATADDNTYWNDTAPTSSVFSIGTNADVNTNTDTYVAYLWSEVAGFSKFGSYTGNGSTDGPFVFCNFRPRFVMVKRTDSTGGWWIRDAVRSSYNVTAEYLGAHSSSAEASSTFADFTSNGFKLRTTDAGENASGGTYVFAAFAEFPAKYSLAR